MMTFHADTNPQVKELLTLLNHSRRRIRIWYGDTITGRSWNDEYHITGTVGRSSGTAKIPLIIANRRSHGGPSILDHCIIRIDDINARKTLYKHPNFHTGLEVRRQTVMQYKNGEHYIVATFDHPFKAQKYFEFMEGRRYHK
jgi:hypothetical protein